MAYDNQAARKNIKRNSITYVNNGSSSEKATL